MRSVAVAEAGGRGFADRGYRKSVRSISRLEFFSKKAFAESIVLLGVCRLWPGRLGTLLFYGLCPQAIELADRDLRVGTNRAIRSSHEKPPAKTRPEVIAFERKHLVA